MLLKGEKTVMFVSLLLVIFCFSAYSDSVQPVISAQVENDKEAETSQQAVSKMASKTKDLMEEHRQTLILIEDTRVYNEQLRKNIESQKEEKLSLRQQIRDVKNMDKQIVPLMLEMLDSLEVFLQLDIPFLKKERESRLRELRTMMNRADITSSEKYRRILEAYQLENEYGRTIGVYQGLKSIGDKEVTVDFLRIGRVSLIYQTFDGKKQGYWSLKEKKWIPLPSKYGKAVFSGIKVARKQMAPNLITAWLAPPQKALPVSISSEPSEGDSLQQEESSSSEPEEDLPKKQPVDMLPNQEQN